MRTLSTIAIVLAVSTFAVAGTGTEDFEGYTLYTQLGAGTTGTGDSGQVMELQSALPIQLYPGSVPAGRHATVVADGLGGNTGQYLIADGGDQHIMFADTTGLTDWTLTVDYYKPTGNNFELQLVTDPTADPGTDWIRIQPDGAFNSSDGWIAGGGSFAANIGWVTDAWNSLVFTYDSTTQTLDATNLTSNTILTGMDVSGIDMEGIARIKWAGGHAIDNITLTPEPASMSLLGLGGLALLRRRRR